MDIGLAFSYVFKDKDWFKKILLPALCALIPFVGQWVVSGWGLKAAKNVIDGKVHDALPDLEFGADLGRGFMAMLITAIYGIPVAIFFAIAGGLFAGAGSANQDAVSIILVILGVCFGIFGLLLIILIALLKVAGIANYLAKGKFGAAFKFKEVFGLVKGSFVSWLLVIVGQILAMSIITPLGAVACFFGAWLTGTYAVAFHSHLLGQAYNKSATPVLGEVEVL